MFTFIDLFAGIGGFHLASERLGGKCVFSSEWDKFSQKTYIENYGCIPHGDITKQNIMDIPDHDILLAGFPCQPFSVAGSKQGFEHKTQGTLFFEIVKIITDKQPKAFILENVKGLLSHNKGATFQIIKDTLQELGYHIFWKVIDSQIVVPQHRKRIYIIGFKEQVDFKFPEFVNMNPKLEDILETTVDSKYTLSDELWSFLQSHAAKHKVRGSGFGFTLADPNSITRTLTARYGKDGSEILIPQEGKNPRRLTPRECARLMGFPDSFKIVVSDSQAYKQFGNSVVIPIIEELIKSIINSLYLPKESLEKKDPMKPPIE